MPDPEQRLRCREWGQWFPAETCRPGTVPLWEEKRQPLLPPDTSASRSRTPSFVQTFDSNLEGWWRWLMQVYRNNCLSNNRFSSTNSRAREVRLIANSHNSDMCICCSTYWEVVYLVTEQQHTKQHNYETDILGTSRLTPIYAHNKCAALKALASDKLTTWFSLVENCFIAKIELLQLASHGNYC